MLPKTFSFNFMQAHGHLSEAQSAVRRCEGEIREAEEQAMEVLEKMKGLKQQEEERSVVSDECGGDEW